VSYTTNNGQINISDDVELELRTFSRSIERRDWSAIASSSEHPNRIDNIDAIKFIVRRVTQSAGWPEGAEPPFLYDLVIYSVSMRGDHIKVSAQSEIEMRSNDGNIRLCNTPVIIELVRAASKWRCWFVTHDASRGAIYHIAAARTGIVNAFASIRSSMGAKGCRISTLECLRVRSAILPPVITVATEDALSISGECPVFDWAVDQAIEHWNRILEGKHRLLHVEGARHTNILIQSIHRPIAGAFYASCYFPGGMYGYEARTDYLIRILVEASVEFIQVPLTPEQVRCSIEHEIGHALGLDDTNQRGALMAPARWSDPIPRPGEFERAGILRIQELCKRFVVATQPQTLKAQGLDRSAFSLESCSLLENHGICRRLARAPDTLPQEQAWIEKIWIGERLLREGDWRQALVSFDEAARLAPNPQPAVLRRHLVSATYIADSAEAVLALEAALRHPHETEPATHPIHLHNILAFRYGEMNEPEMDHIHTTLAEWRSALRRLAYISDWMIASRRPANIVHIFKPLMTVLSWSFRAAKCTGLKRFLPMTVRIAPFLSFKASEKRSAK